MSGCQSFVTFWHGIRCYAQRGRSAAATRVAGKVIVSFAQPIPQVDAIRLVHELHNECKSDLYWGDETKSVTLVSDKAGTAVSFESSGATRHAPAADTWTALSTCMATSQTWRRCAVRSRSGGECSVLPHYPMKVWVEGEIALRKRSKIAPKRYAPNRTPGTAAPSFATWATWLRPQYESTERTTTRDARSKHGATNCKRAIAPDKTQTLTQCKSTKSKAARMGRGLLLHGRFDPAYR